MLGCKPVSVQISSLLFSKYSPRLPHTRGSEADRQEVRTPSLDSPSVILSLSLSLMVSLGSQVRISSQTGGVLPPAPLGLRTRLLALALREARGTVSSGVDVPAAAPRSGPAADALVLSAAVLVLGTCWILPAIIRNRRTSSAHKDALQFLSHKLFTFFCKASTDVSYFQTLSRRAAHPRSLPSSLSSRRCSSVTVAGGQARHRIWEKVASRAFTSPPNVF